MHKIFTFFKTLASKLFLIDDSPQKISLGFGLGVFLGILPGTGPIAALFLASIFRLNKAASLIGSLLVNTWLSIVTFLLAIKTGSVIMGLDWHKIYTDTLLIFKNFHYSNLFKLKILKLIFPVLIGYFIISLIIGILAYLAALILLKYLQKKHARA